MNSKLLGVILMGLAAGGAGAVSVFMIQTFDEGSIQEAGGPTAQQLASLQQQLADVSGAQGDLIRRIQQVELELLRGSTAEREATPMLASTDSVAELKQQVAQLDQALAAIGGNKGAAMFTIEDVGDALETIREEEDAARDAERDAQRVERLADRIAAVSEELGLDTYQQQQLSSVAASASEARNAIMDQVRDSGDWGSLRDSLEGVRDGYDADLSAFMSPDQFTSFSEMGGLGSLSGGNRGPGGWGGGWGGRGGR